MMKVLCTGSMSFEYSNFLFDKDTVNTCYIFKYRRIVLDHRAKSKGMGSR